MAITTIRPDSSQGGQWTVTGTTTVALALNDDSDSTYFQRANNSRNRVNVEFGTTTIPASSVVKQVRARIRYRALSTDVIGTVKLGTSSGPGNGTTAAIMTGVYSSPTTITGPWYSSPPINSGGSWTQTTIDNVYMEITDDSVSGSQARWYEAYIDVDISAPPTTAATAPVGTVTTTSTPTVTWTYTDSEDPQGYYQVKVFSRDQYIAGGFTPQSSTATWGSGQVGSAATSAIVGTALGSGTYRAYVRTAKIINGTPLWSSWVFTEFDLVPARPATPTVVASYSVANGRVTITATGAQTSATLATQTFAFERSIDQITWTGVRNSSAVTPNGSYVATVSDYEAPRGATVYYRVRSTATSSGNLFTSSWGWTTVATTNDGTWWVKPVTALTSSIGAVGVKGGWNEEELEAVGVFRPITRDTAVTVSSGLQGRTGTFTVVCPTAAEWARVTPVLNLTGVMLIEDPLGDARYVKIVKRDWTTGGTVANPLRMLNIGWVEVASGVASNTSVDGYWPAVGTGPSLLAKDAVLWFDPQYAATSQSLPNIGTAGSQLDGQFGSTTGSDATDPKYLSWTATDGNYLYLPGVAGNYAVTNDSAALDVTGDLEIVMRVNLDDWTPAAAQTLISKRGAASQISYRVYITTGGVLTFEWSADGTTVNTSSGVAVPFADGVTGWIKVTIDVVNSTNKTVTLSTAPDQATEPSSWTTTTNTTAGTTSIFASTSNVEIGSYSAGATTPMAGRVYRAIIRSGIGGTVVYDANFVTGVTSGAQTSFTESSSNAATVTITRTTSGRKAVAVARPVVLLGTDDWVTVANDTLFDFSASESFTALVVIRQWATPVNNGRYLSKGVSSGARWFIRSDGTNLAVATTFQDGTNFAAATGSLIASGTAQIATMVVDRSAQTLTMYTNNTASTPSSISGYGSPNNTQPFRLGSDGAGASPQDFELLAAAVFRRKLTAGEIATLVTMYGT